jgi:hypothetical protein
LLTADLLLAARGIVPTSPREDFFPDTELTRQAAALDQPARVRILPMFRPAIPPGFVAPYGIEQFHGYDAIVPARLMHYVSLMARGGWDKMSPVCAVDEIWVKDGEPVDVSTAEIVGEYEGIQVYREPAAFDRAFLVGRARAIPEWRDLLDATLDAGYDPARETLADWLPEGALPNSAAANLGTATVRNRTPNRVEIGVEATESCFLVLADAFFPGWVARVDDAPVEVFPAYHLFRGIVVPEGAHSVTFEYQPRSFRIGFWISTLVLGACTLVSMVMVRRAVWR